MHSESQSTGHVITLLSDYINGTLRPLESAHVRAHLERCAACRQELRAWEQIAGATQQATTTTVAPAPALMARVWATIDAPTPAATSARAAVWTHHWTVLWRQARLLHPAVWLASLAAIIGVTYVASRQAVPLNADLVLSAGLPLIAAVGIAFLAGPEIDPALELAVATPTSPRWVFFSRWMLLVSYNLVLSLLATLVLAALQGQSLWAIMALWLEPMALFATLSALIALALNPVLAMVTALLVWSTRFIQVGADITVVLAAPPHWQTNPLLLPLAAVLLLIALYSAGRQERFA